MDSMKALMLFVGLWVGVVVAMQPPALPDQSAFANISFSQVVKEVVLRRQALLKEPDPCISDLQHSLNKFISPASVLYLFLYTGKGLNELGDMKYCYKNEGYYAVMGMQNNSLPLFVVGVCLPKKCTVAYLSQYLDDIVDFINNLLQPLVITKDNILLYNPAEKAGELLRVTTGTLVCYLLLFLVVVLNGIVLAYEYYERLVLMKPEEENKDIGIFKENEAINATMSGWRKFLHCFNLGINARSLFYSTNKIDPNLDILNGLRVISMLWIIAGHGLLELLAVPLLNSQDLLDDLHSSYGMTFFTSATLSVDVFFMLSGFFAAMSCTEAFAKPQHRKLSSVLMMYLHRYLRLLPIYVFCILLVLYVMPTLYDGPIYSRIINLKKDCPEHWPWNLLYLNNFAKPIEACLPWTWYLTNDFQLFLLAPFIVLLYYHSRILGYCVIGGIALISVFAQLGTIIGLNLNLNLFDASIAADQYEHYYIKPYCRINTYLLGMVLGWMYMSQKNPDHATCFSKPINAAIIKHAWVRYLLYLLGILLIILIPLCNGFFYMHNSQPVGLAALYTIFGRPGFVLAVMFIFYPGLLGKGRGLVFFANELWGCLAKCTYTAYMIHLIVFGYYIYSMEEGTYFTAHRVILNSLDVALITYVLSIVLTLLFESPVIQLSKRFLLPARSPRPQASPLSQDKKEPEKDKLKAAD